MAQIPQIHRTIFIGLSLLITASLLLTACGAVEVGVEPTRGTRATATTDPLPTPAPTDVPNPVPTIPLPTDTAVPPLPSPTAAPVIPTLADTLPPPATATPQGITSVSIVLIAVNDGGKAGPAVGCGDSAVPVTIQIPATQGILRAAFDALLANKSQFYGESGLYNALYQSSLKLDSAKIENGLATLQISGSLLLGGECDNPRVKAQLEGTAKQFSTVKTTVIFINGKPLDEALSLK